MKKSVIISLLLCAASSFCGEKILLPMPKNAKLIDVRTPEEFKTGFISGAVNSPHDRIKEKISAVVPDKKTPLYLYCRSGRRVGVAMKSLKNAGYSVMYNLGGVKEAGNKLGIPLKK